MRRLGSNSVLAEQVGIRIASRPVAVNTRHRPAFGLHSAQIKRIRTGTSYAQTCFVWPLKASATVVYCFDKYA